MCSFILIHLVFVFNSSSKHSFENTFLYLHNLTLPLLTPISCPLHIINWILFPHIFYPSMPPFNSSPLALRTFLLISFLFILSLIFFTATPHTSSDYMLILSRFLLSIRYSLSFHLFPPQKSLDPRTSFQLLRTSSWKGFHSSHTSFLHYFPTHSITLLSLLRISSCIPLALNPAVFIISLPLPLYQYRKSTINLHFMEVPPALLSIY